MHDATGGNPFFALELARTLQRHHGEPAAHEPLPVPEKLHELVASRLGGLTPSVQDALLIAASAARPTVELLTTATGNGSQLVPQLEEAEAADVIRVDRNVIRFTHPLLRSMHISRASRNERRRAHRLLAPVVAEPEERARHLALATAGPDEAVAADLEEAAAHVRARGAAAAAAALLEQSYRLTPATEKEAAARRATDAAEAAFEIGDLDRSKQLIEDVGALDPGREPVVLAMLARVALQTSNAHAIEPYDRAAASAGDPALEADIRISLSNAQYIGGDDLTAAATNARRAIEIADELRDDRLLVRALGAAAAAEALFGGPRAQAILRRGLAVEKRTHDWMRRPNHGFLEARSYGDDQADVRAYATELYEQATAGVAGDVVPAMWGPIYNGAWADMLLGRWPEAKASTDAAIAAALDSRSDHAHAGFLALRALLDAHLGETASARDTAREALDLGARTGIDGPNWGIPVALAALGLVALALRDPAETHARLAPLTARLRRLGIGEPGALRLVPDEIQGLVELGRLEEAHELLAWFDACAVRAERDSARGTAARSRALLSAAAGDLADAEQHLERSRTWLERIELPFELARTLLELGIVRRRLQRKTDARQTLTEAVEHFDRLGAKIWAERARTELGRIGGRAPTEGELSSTESEIARLVIDGRTNRQVAEALHLSTHTVEWNLSRVYRKLGVRSRTQLPRSLR